MSDIDKLRDLIDQYWDIAWREGSDARSHDTEEGSAQECRSAIEAELTTAQSEIEALRAQLKETEAKGRVLMDMCRDLKARVTRLSEALQVAVDTPELRGGTWYDMAVAALAERAGGEK